MKKKSVYRMLAVTALLGIFMNIHHPVTPTLFSEMQLPSRIFGTSFAVMCFCSFITSPFWGEMSDVKGRLKVLMISCIGYGIAQFTLGYCETETAVLLSRSLAGLFASGATIASIAYVADLYSVEERGRGMSIYIAVQSVSLAAGYLTGGMLGMISFRFAFAVQGLGMIGLGMISCLFLEESLNDKKNIVKGQIFKKINPFASFLNARFLMSSAMILFLMAVVLSSFAGTCYDSSLNYYLKDQMNFTPIYNGLLKAVIGLIGLIANFTINMWILTKTRIRVSLAVVLSLCSALALGAVVKDSFILFLVLNLAFYTLNAVYPPIIQTLSVEGRKNEEIGMVTGLINAVKSLGNVAGSLFAGMIYDLSAALPFLIAAVIFMAAAVFAGLFARIKPAA